MQHPNTAKKIGGEGRNPLIKPNFSFCKKKSSHTHSKTPSQPIYQEILSPPHFPQPGFTLVELIIVITILAILSTIAFTSFQNYTKSARDASRTTTLKNIETGLELYTIKNNHYPEPSNIHTISYSGNLLSNQGVFGEAASKAIQLSNIPLDPLDHTPYTYSTDPNQRGYKLLSYLEENHNDEDEIIHNLNFTFLPQTYAKDLKNRFLQTIGNGPAILLTQENENITTDTTLTYTGTTTYQILIETNYTQTGKPRDLIGTFQNMALKGYLGFTPPTSCPEGFIPVPGNKEFGQPGFCVAKYEMSYEDVLTPNSTGGTDWNTVNYQVGKTPVSLPGRYPIANISQIQAIAACKSIGGHLITNNEWMTIARNIELQPKNWSTKIVGQGNLYNGVSNNTTLGCERNGGNTELDRDGGTTPTYATKTGPGGNSCDERRKHTLSNGEEIWDFAGNVWEQVNKTNDIESLNGNGGVFNKDMLDFNSYSFTGGWESDGWKNAGSGTLKKYGPSINYSTSNGVGNIYTGNSPSANIFLRGGAADRYTHTGLFALYLSWASATTASGVGFRCSY